MDYRLPNGTVIRNVPDSMPKHAIQMRAVREGLATNKDFGYEGAAEYQEGMGAAGDTKWDRFREGMGRGMVETARQVGNMFGVISDDELEDAKRLDADLMNTGMGQFGNIVGEIAATLPIGGAVGAAGKGAAMGLRAAQKGGAISRGARLGLGKAVKSPVTRGLVEGSAYGAIFSGPEHRLEGAAIGAGLGAGMGWAGQKIGNAWRNFKLASQSPEAIALQKETGQFIPLSQSGEGIVKMFYNGILANLPGVAGKIRRQYDVAVNDLRHWAATKAHPDTEWAQISLHADDSVPKMMSKLDDFWSTAYDGINSTVMDAGKLKIPAVLTDIIESASRGTYIVPQGTTKGANIMNLRNVLTSMKGQFFGKEQKGLRDMVDKSVAKIDDIIKKNTDDEVFRRYEQLSEPYRNYQILGRAVDKAGGSGEFTATQMLKSAARKEGRKGRGVAPEASYLAVARDAAKALPPFPSQPGIYQLLAATQAGGAIAAIMSAGLATGGVGIAAVIGVGKMMASKRFQQIITGQHNMGRLLDPKYHPWFVRSLKQAGLTARQIAGIESGIIAAGER